MFINQLSIFIENKTGRLYKLTKLLADNQIDLITLSIADTRDFGILRCITNDDEKAEKLLKENGFTVSKTQLLGCIVDDVPGGLANILAIFEEQKISVEYLYSYSRPHLESKEKQAIILFKISNPESVYEQLKGVGVKFIEKL